MVARRFAAVLLCASAIAASGCGGDDASRCPEGTVARGDGCVMVLRDGGSTEGDSGPVPLDGGIDGGRTCTPGADDPPDGIDQDCDGLDGRVDDRVYVSPDGDDTSLGTASDPVRTIGRALERDRPVLILATGSYEEDVTITSVSVSINGGYTPGTWERTAGQSTLALVSAPLAYSGVVGRDERLTLSQVEVLAPAATEPGDSSIGITAQAGTLRLVDSRVVAGPGADGVDGTRGATGADGRDGRAGASCATYPACTIGAAPGGAAATSSCGAVTTSGAGGESETAGRPAPTGAGGGASPVYGGPGEAGEEGEPGDRGANGAGATEIGAFSATGYDPPTAEAGRAGMPGTGGGGGGGARGSEYAGCAEPLTSIHPPGAGGGSGGAGGCPGGGGQGGGGGGGSVGILASGATVLLERSEIVTEGGGRGGRGGASGPGGPGGGPGAGGARLCSTSGYLGHEGGAGGAGGPGGAGGHGGGGVGGPSAGLVLRNGSTWEGVDASFDIGAGGLGGSSDGNPGAPGPSLESLDVP